MRAIKVLFVLVCVAKASLSWATCSMDDFKFDPSEVCASNNADSRDCDLARAQKRYCDSADLRDGSSSTNPPVFYTSGPEIREQRSFCIKNSGAGTAPSACYQLDQEIPFNRYIVGGEIPEGAGVKFIRGSSPASATPDGFGNIWSGDDQEFTISCMALDANVSSPTTPRKNHCGVDTESYPFHNMVFRIPLVYNGDVFLSNKPNELDLIIEPVTGDTSLWFSTSALSNLISDPDRTRFLYENWHDPILIHQDEDVVGYGGISIPAKDVWCSRHQPRWSPNAPSTDTCRLSLAPWGYGYENAGLSKIYSLGDINNSEDPVWRIYYPAGAPEGSDPREEDSALPGDSLIRIGMAHIDSADGENPNSVNAHLDVSDQANRIWFIAGSTEHASRIGYFEPSDFDDGDPKTDPYRDCNDDAEFCLPYIEPLCSVGIYGSCFRYIDLPVQSSIVDFVFDQYGDIWFVAFTGMVGRVEFERYYDEAAEKYKIVWDENGPSVKSIHLYPSDTPLNYSPKDSQGHITFYEHDVAGAAIVFADLIKVKVGSNENHEFITGHALGINASTIFDITRAASSEEGCELSHDDTFSSTYDNPCFQQQYLGRSDLSGSLGEIVTAHGAQTSSPKGAIINSSFGVARGDQGQKIVSTPNFIVFANDELKDLVNTTSPVPWSNFMSMSGSGKGVEYLLGSPALFGVDLALRYEDADGNLWGSYAVGGGDTIYSAFVSYRIMDSLIVEPYADYTDAVSSDWFFDDLFAYREFDFFIQDPADATPDITEDTHIPVTRFGVHGKNNSCLGAGVDDCIVILADDKDSFGIHILKNSSTSINLDIEFWTCSSSGGNLCGSHSVTYSDDTVTITDPHVQTNVIALDAGFKPSGNGIYIYKIDDGSTTSYVLVKVGNITDDTDGDTISDIDEFGAIGKWVSGSAYGSIATDFTSADTDGDSVDDSDDVFPHDINESIDTDGDFIGDGVDPDNDGDGYCDSNMGSGYLGVCIGDESTSGSCDNIANGYSQCTNPNSVDSDDDGMPDGWELLHALDGMTNNAAADPDGDNLDNYDEYHLTATDPNNPDTDGDGINDGIEYGLSLNPRNYFVPVKFNASAGGIVGFDKLTYELLSADILNNDANVTANLKVWDSNTGAWSFQTSVQSYSDHDTTLMDLVLADPSGLYSAYLTWAPVADITNITKVSMSYKLDDPNGNYVCVLTSTPAVICGYPNPSNPSGFPAGPTLPTLYTPSDIATGPGYGCAVHQVGGDGVIECWGDVGADKAIPVSPQLESGTEAVAIAGGDHHLCAIVEVISTGDRLVQCWGYDALNQLGDDNNDGMVDGIEDVLKIDAGANHTCVLTGTYATPTGLAVSCWGDNRLYQTTVPTGLQANGGDTPVDVRAGDDRTCAVKAGSGIETAEQALVCWPIGISANTNPSDSDGDGYLDADEINILMTSPVSDSDPSSSDIDGDSISNISEIENGTNPLMNDSDCDGDPDGSDNTLDALVPGDADCSLDGDGELTTGFNLGSNNNDQAHAMMKQADGRLVLVGSAFNGLNNDFAVVRYLKNGLLDTISNGSSAPFGTNGKVTTSILSGGWDIGKAVIQQHDGKIVMAGYSGSSTVYDHISLVRYNKDGSLDTSFDTDGKVEFSNPSGLLFTHATALIQQSDGKLVVAGYGQNTSTSTYDGVLVRYNLDGSLDDTFDGDSGTGNGVVITSFTSFTDQFFALIQDSNGKLVVAGRAGGDFAVARYNLDGSLDTSFDNDGKLTTSISSTGTEWGNSMVEQSDGKLVVAGFTAGSNGTDFAVIRYNANGSLDTGTTGDTDTLDQFGIVVSGQTYSYGWQKVDTSLGNDYATGLALQDDGKIVASGTSDSTVAGGPGATGDFALCRLTDSGALDTGFDSDGIQLHSINTVDVGNAMLIQSDGHIVVGGYTATSSYGTDFVLLRYLP